MKRLAIHKNLITLLLVIFAVVVMHTLQSMHKDIKQSADEAAPHHLLAR
ncbi:MAG: hypothetical protein ACTHMM_16325 [Agriterribacter sp.]